ncbi:MAG TPA: type VI secretion system ATPase TssH, partial [Polyangia bacterium]
MAEITRVSLFGKLNPLAYKAVESATVFCKLRGNPYVELVHWFSQILQLPDSDVHHIVREFRLDPARLARDMTEALDQLPRGATSISDLSSRLDEALERAWVYGTLLFGERQVRTGRLVVGLLKTPGLRNALSSMSREFDAIKVEQLSDRFREITEGSPEDVMGPSERIQTDAAPGEASLAL